MKHEFITKLKFAILGILLVTWFSYYIGDIIRNRQEHNLKIKEGMDDPVGDAIKDAFKPLTDVFDKLAKFFNGINTLSEGIDFHFKCGSKTLNDGYSRGLKILGIQFDCFWVSFARFFNGKCTLYYILDIIFGIVYLIIVDIPLFLLKAIFGVDLYFIVEFIKDVIINPLDSITTSMMGFSITRWSDDVQKRCYLCPGDIGDGNGRQYKTFGEWSKYYKCTTAMINNGTNVIVKTVFGVDNHWKHWFWDENNNKSNWDDWPEYKTPPAAATIAAPVAETDGGKPL